MARIAGILGGDEIHLGKHLDGSLGEVCQVSDGSGDEVEGGGGDLILFRHGNLLMT